MHRNYALVLMFLFQFPVAFSQTVVGIRGCQFTVNGIPTYTAASGYPRANPRLEGTLLNVRAVQAIFDDPQYPAMGSKKHPYQSSLMGPIAFDYPDGLFSAGRNLGEFLEALPAWHRAGVLAITVNLQGGGPSDGNFGTHNQPQLNSGFDPRGNLKPAYAARLRRVIAKADQLGMVVIVGYFYQGSEHWVDAAPDDKYVKEAIRQASLFLMKLPNRNILIEIANEVSSTMYQHPILQPEGILDAVKLAQKTVQHQIPVSFSWIGQPPLQDSRADTALHTADYVLIHTNGKTPEGVHEYIQAMRGAEGNSRPLLINEDGVSAFNLEAAVDEHVGWGYYDQGLNQYRDGFQSPPVNWKINTDAKWIFFEQVARLSGSPSPPRPFHDDPTSPSIKLIGLSEGQVLRQDARIEALVTDRDPRWPIRRVEFFIDGKPYSYSESGPYLLGNREPASIKDLAAGKHTLLVVAYDELGPKFTEICSILEVSIRTENGP
jgi:hypothetical protein